MARKKANRKATSPDVASNAAKLLSNARTSDKVRSVAASALAQAAPVERPKSTKRLGAAFKAGKDLEE